MFLRVSQIVLSIFAILIVMSSSTSRLHAQSSVLPTPGTIIDSVDKQVQQAPEAKDVPPASAQENNFTPPTYNKKIQVDKFVLTGNSLFSEEKLLEGIGQYINVPITLGEIYEAADSIQLFYRSQGYLLASVYVPAQKISSGTVRLEIIEGKLAGILVEGELESYDPKFIIEQFDSLQLGDVVTSNALEEEVLLLNDMPGLTGRAVILPGAEYGTSNVAIRAEEERTLTTVKLTNHGRKSTGEINLQVGLLYVNPFFQGDQINLSAVVSEESRIIFLRSDYDAPVNRSGTRVGIGISAFEYDVDTAEIGLAGTLEGDGINIRLLISHPLIRKQRNRLDISAAIRSNETSQDGSLAPSTASKSIEIFDLSIQWQPIHTGRSSSSLSATLSSNFESNPNGTKNDAEKAKLSLDYSYNQLFAENWFALFRVGVVASDDPLPDSERYRLGGPTSVRAFPSSELAGDEGEFFGLDVGRRFSLADDTNLLVKLFADTGRVKRIIPAAGELAEDRLTGYGLGFLLDINSDHIFELEFVKPTTNQVSSDRRDSRVWASYSAKF
jgi:hemolysin activation/secretion protein